MKRIIYLLEHWLPPGTPGSTGGTLYNYQLVEALSRHAEVDVIALNAPVQSVPHGVKITVFDEPVRCVSGLRFLGWKSILMDQLPKDGRGIVLLTTTSTNAIVDLAKRRGFRVVSIVQAYEDFGFFVPGGSLRDRLRGVKKRLATAQWFGPSLLRADRIIVNSEYMKGMITLVLRCRRTVSVLYPPLTLPVDLSSGFSEDALESVGFVNRSGKNLSFFIDLAKALPEKRFLIFGHPVPGNICLPGNIVFWGWASDRKLMFQKAYTWVMPSSWSEPFGLVAIEALSQGCRVAVSSKGGLPEAVGLCGVVFSDFDVKHWSDQILSGSHTCSADSTIDHLRKFSLDCFDGNVLHIFNDIWKLDDACLV